MKWPGHPYHCPKLPKRQNIPWIGLWGGRSALGKWLAVPSARFLWTQQKAAFQKQLMFRWTNHYIKQIWACLDLLRFNYVELMACCHSISDHIELVEVWLEAVQPSRESTSYLTDSLSQRKNVYGSRCGSVTCVCWWKGSETIWWDIQKRCIEDEARTVAHD